LNESLGIQESIQLFYKMDETIKNIVATQFEDFTALVTFEQILIDLLSS
jgi:hypothetical protein